MIADRRGGGLYGFPALCHSAIIHRCIGPRPTEMAPVGYSDSQADGTIHHRLCGKWDLGRCMDKGQRETQRQGAEPEAVAEAAASRHSDSQADGNNISL